MKSWDVRLKVDLGDTVIECTVTVRAGDRYDAVAGALASAFGTAKVMSVTEARDG